MITAEIASDPRWQLYGKLAAQHGIRACWSVPFHDRQSLVLGTFAVYHRVARAPSPAEWDTLNNAAHLAAVAVERKYTETALCEREELYRLITENSGELISVIDQDGNFLYASSSYTQMLGYDPAALSPEHGALPSCRRLVALDRGARRDGRARRELAGGLRRP